MPARATSIGSSYVASQDVDPGPADRVTTAPDGLSVSVLVVDRLELGLMGVFVDQTEPLDGDSRGHCRPCSRSLSQTSHCVCRRLTLLLTPHRLRVCAFGGGVIGNTAGSGPVIEGSSPSPRARVGMSRPNLVPSSRGLGRRPLKPETPVQIRSGLPGTPQEAVVSTHAHEPISGA